MKTVVVDTDALIALINKGDTLATKSIEILGVLYKKEVKLIYPATTIVEAITTVQRKLSNPMLATELAQMLRSGQFDIVAVDQEILELAETLFKPGGSKQNTMFDSIVAAVAKTLGADAIFSFDKWYEKIGLKLATSLVQEL